ncbi:uncharacterized protein BKA78DRAFT_157465 [Phyllosticta capitalensis]|uniref:uncharacterized protein n=1 Tax=Phyllosticta capitalensis TaxID=121624 RepID=UPI0031321E5C
MYIRISTCLCDAGTKPSHSPQPRTLFYRDSLTSMPLPAGWAWAPSPSTTCAAQVAKMQPSPLPCQYLLPLTPKPFPSFRSHAPNPHASICTATAAVRAGSVSRLRSPRSAPAPPLLTH